jgi:hypothetical protein
MDDRFSFQTSAETEASYKGLQVSTETQDCQQVDTAKRTQNTFNSSSTLSHM